MLISFSIALSWEVKWFLSLSDNSDSYSDSTVNIHDNIWLTAVHNAGFSLRVGTAVQALLYVSQNNFDVFKNVVYSY